MDGSFKSYCTCGGFRRSQDDGNPHKTWCPQHGEWKPPEPPALPVFEIDPGSGRPRLKIYASGRVEGWLEGSCMIVNRIQMLEQAAWANGFQKGLQERDGPLDNATPAKNLDGRTKRR